jgi:hypothetical protein
MLLLAVFAISVLIWNWYYNEIFTNPFHYYSNKLLYAGYWQTIQDTVWILCSSLEILIAVLSIVGLVGILIKRNWGRNLSIISLWVIVFFFVLEIVSLLVMPQSLYQQENVFLEITLPIVISVIVVSTSILSLIYLVRPHIKKYFVNRKATELSRTNSS